MRMTYKEWLKKKENDKLVKNYLEKSRQQTFSEQQNKESIMTRQINSIVDVDSV